MCSSENSSTAEPQRFSVMIPTLERLATQEMSLILYKKEIHPGICYNISDCYDWLIDPYFDPEDIIDGLPSVISKMIKQCMEELAATSITGWCFYHNEHVFFDGCSLNEGMANSIDQFVLKRNGRINFRSTAKNVIMGEKLNLVEKYRLACLYGLVDDVRRIWPMVQDNPRVTGLNPVHYPIIHYWNCVMKGESRRFPGTDPDSLEECLVILNDLTWESIEYFWNALSSDERVTAAKQLLMGIEGDGMRTSFIEPLLLRLDKTQLRRIMSETLFIEALFKTYLGHFRIWECPEIFNIWIHMKQYISSLEFFKIICIFIDSFKRESEYGALLFEVWTSASDEFRDSFLNNSEAVITIFQRLPAARNIDNYSDMRFFIDVLRITRLDFEFKKNIWFEFWPKLIIHTSANCLDLMMKVCFRKEDEIIQFKERMMNLDEIDDFCNLCFQGGHMSKVNDFLNFCSSNILHVTEMKQQIIRSKKFLASFWFNSFAGGLQRAVDNLGKFIDSASFNEEEAAYHKKIYSNSRLRSHSVFCGLSEESSDGLDE